MASLGTGHASLIGQRLGEYKVLALIGRGAMGTVYLAQDVELMRNVALKVLLGHLARNPDAVRQFHREAQAAAPLRHANIVRIFSAGIESGTPYIAMEFIEGEPLDRFLRRQSSLPWQTALYIGRQVADALACAHDHDVIHRDVKPANILLDRHGKARLTDFGIANAARLQGEHVVEGGYIGTPHYMSPEQCARKPVSPATDLYSLGVTLYFLISGRLPFEHGDPVSLMKSITNDEAPRLNRIMSSVPDDVARLVAHLMSKESADRPANAGAAIAAIDRVQEEKGGQSAMPAALASFMREQTRIRPVRTLIKPHAGLEDGAAAERPRLPLRTLAMRGAAVLATVVVCAMVPPLLAMALRGRAVTPETREPAGFTLRDISPHLRTAGFEGPGFECAGVEWVGSRNALVAHIRGRTGTVTEHASGLMSVDIDNRTATTLLPPASALLDPALHDMRPPVLALPAPPPDVPESPLHERVLLPRFGRRLRPDARRVRLEAWTWNAAGDPALLYTAEPEAWAPGRGTPWRDTLCGAAAPSPDGFTLALAMTDPETGEPFIAEHDTRWEEPGRLGPRFGPQGGRVIAHTLRYSPSGNYIGYVRVAPGGETELWVHQLPRSGPTQGQVIAWAVDAQAHSFSPDESLVAVRVEQADGVHGIRLVSSRNPIVVAELGPGVLGAQPWHPSGTFVAATDGGRVWALESVPPHRRIALSPERFQAAHGASFSTDGGWLAAPGVRDEGPEILLMRVEEQRFEELM